MVQEVGGGRLAVRPPRVGAPVAVRWVDGQLYAATFNGTREVATFTVTFEDGSVREVERDGVYGERDALPARVRSKLVSISLWREDL